MIKFVLLVIFIGYASAQNCSDATCDHGRCKVANDSYSWCQCDEVYVTHPADSPVECNYKQKDGRIAFPIEFFTFAAGGGYWYIGDTDTAVGQLIYCIVGMVALCIVTCIFAATCKDAGMFFVGIYAAFWVIGGIIWWIYSLVDIGKGNATDENGVAIYAL
jgi:hypothetical protein